MNYPTQADSSAHVSSWCVPSLHVHVFQGSSSKTKLSSRDPSRLCGAFQCMGNGAFVALFGVYAFRGFDKALTDINCVHEHPREPEVSTYSISGLPRYAVQ